MRAIAGRFVPRTDKDQIAPTKIKLAPTSIRIAPTSIEFAPTRHRDRTDKHQVRTDKNRRSHRQVSRSHRQASGIAPTRIAGVDFLQREGPQMTRLGIAVGVVVAAVVAGTTVGVGSQEARPHSERTGGDGQAILASEDTVGRSRLCRGAGRTSTRTASRSSVLTRWRASSSRRSMIRSSPSSSGSATRRGSVARPPSADAILARARSIGTNTTARRTAGRGW